MNFPSIRCVVFKSATPQCVGNYSSRLVPNPLPTKLADLARWDLVAAQTKDECTCHDEAGGSADESVMPKKRVGKMRIGTFSLHRREQMRRLHSTPRIVGSYDTDCVYSCACGRGDISCQAAQFDQGVVLHDFFTAKHVALGVVAPWLHLGPDQVCI